MKRDETFINRLSSSAAEHGGRGGFSQDWLPCLVFISESSRVQAALQHKLIHVNLTWTNPGRAIHQIS